ncbi:MAG TPA: type II CAAX endopeptidase family protein [Clostridia bacterium]|nr:type II CAAX endopeptidase family protein [Clostridia bacterium]
MERLQKNSRQPTVLGVNIVYIGVLLLMLLAQVLLMKWIPQTSDSSSYYWRLFILELVLIGGPPLVYMVIFKMDIGRIARFNKIKTVEVLLVLGMAIFGYGVTIIINLIWFWIASHWGVPEGQALPAIETGAQFLAAVLAIGIVPAVVEEFLFRGLILRGYEKFGSKVAIIMTGILFGMLHMQLMSIPSIILLGIIISYVVYRTDSILAGIIYHFVHNTMTVGILFLQNKIQLDAGAVEGLPQDISQFSDEMLTIAFVVWGVIGFFALILFLVCLISLHKYTAGKGQVRITSEGETRRSTFVEMLPAIIAMAIVLSSVIVEVLNMIGVIEV